MENNNFGLDGILGHKLSSLIGGVAIPAALAFIKYKYPQYFEALLSIIATGGVSGLLLYKGHDKKE